MSEQSSSDLENTSCSIKRTNSKESELAFCLPSETWDQFFKHTQAVQEPNSEKYVGIYTV